MNKLVFKILTCVFATAVAVGAFAFSSCATEKDYYGEYHYENPWSAEAPDYGIKVKVEVRSGEDGDVIDEVEIVKSDYVEVTENWSDKEIWYNGIEKLLESYEGKKVSDILAAKVTVNDDGEPQSVSDSDFVISGATQGSGRLLLAIQSALK